MKRKSRSIRPVNFPAVLSGDLSSLTPASPTGPKKPRPSAFTAGAKVPLEADVQKAVLKALKYHPKVAWVGRYNSGTMEEQGATGDTRYVTFNSVPGQSDLMGQMKDGRILAIEVKRPGGKPTERQAAFLALVARNGGVSGFACSVDDALSIIDAASA